MPWWMVLLIPLAFFATAYGIVYVLHQQQVRRLQTFAGLLEDGEALIDPRSLSLEGVVVRGQLDAREVRLRVRSESTGRGEHRSGRPLERLEVEVRDPIAGFKISRAHLLNRFGVAIGAMRDVQTDDARVDEKYVLDGRPDALGRLLEQPGAEAALDGLLEDYGVVELVDGQLQVEGGRPVPPAQLLHRLRELVLLARLCDRKPIEVEALGVKVHFAWTGGGQDTLCPYCRDELESAALELSACDDCATVHHRACLDEAGTCSVFGCGGTKAARKVKAD